MPEDRLVLKRSCGRFVKIRGSDDVLHYMKYWPHQVSEATALWELASLRMLRYAIADGLLEGVEASAMSLSMFMGSALMNALKRRQDSVQLTQIESEISTLMEGVKLGALLSKDAIPHVTWNFLSREPAPPSLRFLHDRIEHEETRIKLGKAERRSNPLRASYDVLAEDGIVVLDAVKRSQDLAVRALRELCEDEVASRAQGEVFLSFRSTRGEPIQAWDVQGSELTLPNIYAAMKSLHDAGWQIAFHYSRDFDRNFLLPFEGDYGLVMLHLARKPERLLSTDAFERYRGQEEQVEERAVAVFSDEALQSYDAIFTFELPQIASPSEPNWRQWAAERDWDPAREGLGTEPLDVEAEMAVLALASTGSPGEFYEWSSSALEEASRSDQISALGLIALASTKRQENKGDESRRLLARALRKTPRDEDAALWLISTALFIGGPEMDVSPFTRALASIPDVSFSALDGALKKCTFITENRFEQMAPIARRYLDEIEKRPFEAEDRPEMLSFIMSILIESGDNSSELARAARLYTQIAPDQAYGWLALAVSDIRGSGSGYPKLMTRSAECSEVAEAAEILAERLLDELRPQGFQMPKDAPYAEKLTALSKVRFV